MLNRSQPLACHASFPSRQEVRKYFIEKLRFERFIRFLLPRYKIWFD